MFPCVLFYRLKQEQMGAVHLLCAGGMLAEGAHVQTWFSHIIMFPELHVVDVHMSAVRQCSAVMATGKYIKHVIEKMYI